MKLLNDRPSFAGSRPANCPRWLFEVVSKFRRLGAGRVGRAVGRRSAGIVGLRHVGGGLAPIAHGWLRLFDEEVIAAVCECPSLAVELLTKTHDGVAAERVELDATAARKVER